MPVFHVHKLGSNQLRRLSAGLRARLTVRVSERGRVVARMRARVGGRMRWVASAAKAVPHGGTVDLRLRLSRAALVQLRARGHLRLLVVVRYSPVSQVDRERVELSLRDGETAR